MNTKLIDVQEAADYLGLKKTTLYTWVHNNKIEYVKIGKNLRFRLSTLEEFIQQNIVIAK